MNAEIARLLSEIRAYTAVHAELRLAHHFLFDLHLKPRCAVKFFVLGINPGEADRDWEYSPKPTEETSEYDFHEENGMGRDSVRWSKLCDELLGTTDVLLAELFFWSSRDQVQFRDRFGPLSGNRHLPFCTAMNRRLLDIYSPTAVICPGLGSMPVAESEYGLAPANAPAVTSAKGHRLVEIRTDGMRPWIFTKHWTGARLSKIEKVQIGNAIAEVVRGSQIFRPV